MGLEKNSIHACGYSSDGDTGDDADEGLAALGAQIAGRDEEFEAHEKAISCQLSAFSQDWIIAIGLEKAATIGLCAQIRYHRVDSLTIRDKFCAEAPLEFGVADAGLELFEEGDESLRRRLCLCVFSTQPGADISADTIQYLNLWPGVHDATTRHRRAKRDSLAPQGWLSRVGIVPGKPGIR